MSAILLYAVLGLLAWGALIVLAVAMFHRAVLERERVDAFDDEHCDRERVGLPIEHYRGERRMVQERARARRRRVRR